VVLHDKRHVALRREPQEERAQQRPPGDVEGALRLLREPALRLLPGVGQTRKVDHRQ
jgi:hypothetical protein